MDRVIIVADDLTGANDTGLQFAKQGLVTKVLIGEAKDMTQILDADVCVLNSESRSLPADQAYEQLFQLTEEIKGYDYSLFYKKVDSTLRGNVGIEIDALMDSIPFDFAVIAPAYPKIGRRTVGGYHIVFEEVLEDSEFSKDPKFPISNSYIPKLIQNQTSKQVGHLDLNDMRSSALPMQIAKRIAQGEQLLVFDCMNEQDFNLMIDAVLHQKKKVLWVGSAGLMSVLSEKLLNVTPKVNVPVESNLVIAGSVSAKTKEQVTYLESKGFLIYRLNPLDLLSEVFNEEKLPALLQKIESDLKEKRNVAVTTENSTEIRQKLDNYANKQDLPKEKIGDLLAQKLGLIGSKLIKQAELKGVFLTGGDIAYQTCYQLDLKALQVVGEVEEGIPLCRINEQALPNIPFVTKAGAFGNKYSIYNSVLKMADFYKK